MDLYHRALGPLSKHACQPYHYHYLLKQEALMRVCATQIEAQSVVYEQPLCDPTHAFRRVADVPEP